MSEFAWSLETKKSIGSKDYIKITPGDTALIYTEESIYVSECIGGSYHSKVTLAAKGLSHIGTTLDAQYLGCSLVSIHNHSKDVVSLKTGSEFVTLQLNYLCTPGYPNSPSHDNEPGHPRMLNGYQNVDQYIEWRDRNKWTTSKIDLIHKMEESEDFKRCKEEYERELEVFNHKKRRRQTVFYFKLGLILIAVVAIVSIPSYLVDLGKISVTIKALSEKIVYPALVAVLTAYIMMDIKKDDK